MGGAEDWQSAMTARLSDLGVVILNPRRDDWDSSWKQSIEDERFRGHVEWEPDGLERAQVIAMWFAPDTHAPVTLLELGLTATAVDIATGSGSFDRSSRAHTVQRTRWSLFILMHATSA